VSAPAVTLSRSCAVCGGDLHGRRSHARTCSNRCRQADHRRKHAPPPKLVELTPELRRWLADQVARRRLEQAGGYLTVERLCRALDERVA
jgi:hypothetical protein